jgi:hyperosmotically inducible protein
MDDRAVTSRVKYKMAQSPTVSAFDIQVTTYEGVVQLSGFVEYDIQSRTAEEIATSVPEVREVRNSIQVRKESSVTSEPRANLRSP